jgi:protein required for attachment to host cells
MQKASIPHDALVFVGDGKRAVFFRNQGTIQEPDLEVEAVLRQEKPPTREQGAAPRPRPFTYRPTAQLRRGN